MGNGIDAVRYPELVIGIAGALGIDIEEIVSSLTDALAAVSYKTRLIHITREIADEITNVPLPTTSDFAAEANFKMDHANAVCLKYGGPETLMRFAIRAIRQHRANQIVVAGMDESTPPDERVIPRTAYIIRKLKRPEEVHLLRKVYGKQFILLSAYGSMESRRSALETKLKRSLPLNTPEYEISCNAEELLHRDQNEGIERSGQHLRDTFHLADVFIDGISKIAMQDTIARFINAFLERLILLQVKRSMECMLQNQPHSDQVTFLDKLARPYLQLKEN